jgi:hypothetical protein
MSMMNLWNLCRTSRTAGGIALAALVGSLALPNALEAQSCILTRLDSPVLSAFGDEFGAEQQRWQATMGYRYGYSFRHFRGSHEEPNRVEEHSQVVNNVSLLDFGVRYYFNQRTSLSVGIPYVDATRDAGLRDENRVVVQRYQRSHTDGLGDVTAILNRLLWDPATHRRSNLSLGVGIKIPTGSYDQEQTRLSFDDDGTIVSSTSVADYSVQPGDFRGLRSGCRCRQHRCSGVTRMHRFAGDRRRRRRRPGRCRRRKAAHTRHPAQRPLRVCTRPLRR